MSEVLDEFPAKSHGLSIYPWGEWFDGRVHKLIAGQDFKVSNVSFRGAIYAKAKRSGHKVRVHICDGGMIIQAMKHGQP